MPALSASPVAPCWTRSMSCGLISPGRRLPCAHPPRPPVSGVLPGKSAQAMQRRGVCCLRACTRGGVRPRTSIYGLTLRRAIYCLIYLWRFPPASAPTFFRPRNGGRGGVWTPGPDPTCVCRKMDLYSG